LIAYKANKAATEIIITATSNRNVAGDERGAIIAATEENAPFRIR
jgi:hypothetical protein